MPDVPLNAAVDFKGRKGRAAIITSFSVLLVIVCGIYACIASALHSKATLSFLILRPGVGADEFYEQELVPGIKKQSLFVTAVDGSKLHAWLFKLPGSVSKKLALVSHGNAGNLSNRIYLANALTKSGCSVLLYDYRGYGLSTGKCSIDNICDDGATMYKFATGDLGYKPNQIVLYGESIGTAVTCSVAANFPCAGVILQSGFSSLPSVGRHLFPVLMLFPDAIFAEPQFRDSDRVKELHVPILFLHGKLDHVVPFQDSELMFANANQPKSLVLLPDCGHNDMGVQNATEFHGAIGGFIKSLR
jgi:fermentation-respiration switch protein FrsA (DUF1100 family)